MTSYPVWRGPAGGLEPEDRARVDAAVAASETINAVVGEVTAARDAVVPAAAQVSEDLAAVEAARAAVIPAAEQVAQDRDAVVAARDAVVPAAEQVAQDLAAAEGARDAAVAAADRVDLGALDDAVAATAADRAQVAADADRAEAAAQALPTSAMLLIGASDPIPDGWATTQTFDAGGVSFRIIKRGFNFYVDSVNGDDSNDGTTAATAFATLGAVRTAALAYGNGVKIGLAYGSEWREDLNLSALSGVTVDAYGDKSLGLPILDGSYVFSGTWADSAARADANSNTYSTSVTQTIGEGFLSVWDAGVKPTWVASVALVNSTPGSFTVVGPTSSSGMSAAGTQTIYFHPADNSNPNTNGRTVELTDHTRDGRLYLGDGSTLRRVHTRRNSHANGSMQMGANAVAEYVLASDGVKHECLIASGRFTKCVAWHPYSDSRSNNICMEFYKGDGVGFSCLYDGCISVGPGGGAAQVVSAFSGHNNGPGTLYDSVECRDSVAYKCNSGFNLEAQGPITVTRFHAKSCRIGVKGKASQLTVTDFWADGSEDWFQYGVDANNGTPLVVDGMRGYMGVAGSATGFIRMGTGASGQVADVRNSVFVLDANDFMSGVVQYAGANLTLLGNIFEARATGGGRKFNPWVHVVNFASLTTNNNNFSEIGDTLLFGINGGTTYTNATNYLANYPGYDDNSTAINAGISNPAGGDWSMTYTGPAGLDRPDISYTPIPDTIADAEAWILAAA